MLIPASSASVEWSSTHNRWEVHIHVGAEVIKRPVKDHAGDAGADALRSKAVEIARDEGYELNAANVTVAARA